VVSWLASGIAVALENGADAAGVVQLLITSSVPTAKGELHMGVAAAPLAGWGDENPYVPLDVLNAFFEERGKAWRDVSTDRIIRASEKLLRQSIVDAKTIPELSKQLLSRILATIGKDPARALVFDAERKREERGGTPGQLSPQRCNAGRNRAACTLVMHDTSLEEIIARRVAGETLADLRTVRREMRAPGSVRGLIGVRVRAALNRHRRRDAIPPVA